MIDNSEAHDEVAFFRALTDAGCTVKGKSSTCPWHDDSTPSASILQGQDGHWRLHCHRCDRTGDVYDIRSSITGRNEFKEAKVMARSNFPSKKEKSAVEAETGPSVDPGVPSTGDLKGKQAVVDMVKRAGVPQAWYKYGPPDAPVLLIVRLMPHGGAKKQFRQFTCHPDGTYTAKNLIPRGSIPLYRSHEVAGVDTVLVVEGEKACDAAWAMGIPAVTSAMGGKNAESSDWSSLADKRVVIWPDNDTVGTEYADTVTKILAELGARVGRLDPSLMCMPEGGDIADLWEKWGKNPSADEIDAVKTFIGDAQFGSYADTLAAWQAEVIAGKWQTLDMPHANLGALTRAMMPGAVTILCADPGAGKSWFMLQCMQFWNKAGHKAAVRMMEDDIRMHLARLLTQLTGNNHGCDKWVMANQMVVDEDMRNHRDEIDKLGALITAEDDDDLPSHKDIIAWVERKAKAGCRVVMIDPITAVKQGREPWLQDFELSMRLKSIAKKYKMSVIVTTHPRGTAKEPSLTGMAGGNAWTRFCHTALWLSQMNPKQHTLIDGTTVMADRVVHILKCRYGKGNKMSIAMTFEGNCTMKEAGVIMPKKQKDEQQDDQHMPPPPSNRAAKLRSQPSDTEDLFHG